MRETAYRLQVTESQKEATVWNFEAIHDKFDVDRICSLLACKK
jgi:hypothetical protein